MRRLVDKKVHSGAQLEGDGIRQARVRLTRKLTDVDFVTTIIMEQITAASQFLLQSPPGQINDVLNGGYWLV